MIKFKQVLIPKTNMLPNVYTKKQVVNQEAMKIDDDHVCEIIKDVHRRDKIDKKFDIESISKFDEPTSNNEKEISGDKLS